MKLLITGATGFVGRNLLIQALAGGQYESVIACVRNPTKLNDQLRSEGIDFAKVKMIPWGESLGAQLQIDHAIHCAGVLFARDRDAYFSVNVDETMRVIRSLPAATRLVVLSSQSAGGPTPAGQSERSMSDEDAPLTWYGESKVALERAVMDCRPDALIIRPPMILGPRDQATLPLFKMAAGVLRPKPGIKVKTYSWIAVEDLVRDLLALINAPDWTSHTSRTMYAAAPDTISDVSLVQAAASLLGANGFDLPLPHPVLGLVARVVDAIPALRDGVPTLTRDRVREVFADRWVVDAGRYRTLAGANPYCPLRETMARTLAWYRSTGQIQ
ncbi:MAG: NAD-dependent epimerase/dehydratase family protein [Chthoniobacterales bacterium]